MKCYICGWWPVKEIDASGYCESCAAGDTRWQVSAVASRYRAIEAARDQDGDRPAVPSRARDSVPVCGSVVEVAEAIAQAVPAGTELTDRKGS